MEQDYDGLLTAEPGEIAMVKHRENGDLFIAEADENGILRAGNKWFFKEDYEKT